MARVKLQLPENFIFNTKLNVRINDINYGGHLGNDSILSIIHEARVRFLDHFGQREMKFFGTGIIMSDVVIEFKNESFYGDIIEISVAVGDFSRVGFDMYYSLINDAGKEIAKAKTGIVCFDYDSRRPVAVPEECKKLWGK